MKAPALAICALALGASGMLAQAPAKAAAAPSQQSPSANGAQARRQMGARGQEVFQHNCARCHNAPEFFPGSVSGTIAHHMRVRANLSDVQYKALLQFLNP